MTMLSATVCNSADIKAPIEFEHVSIPTPPSKVLTLDATAMREGQYKLDKEAVTEFLNLVQAELERKIKTPYKSVNVYLEDFDFSLKDLQVIQWAIEEQGYQVRYSSKGEVFYIRW